MLSWLPRRRVRLECIEVEADILIRDLGVEAYVEARRREHEASSDAIAQDWGRVALAVAHKTGNQIGLDTSTRMAMAADFSDRRRSGCGRMDPRSPELDQMEELRCVISGR